MRLIVECEHGRLEAHPKSRGEGVNAMVASTAGPREFDPSKLDWCFAAKTLTDPDAILAALAEAGVLDPEPTVSYGRGKQHSSPDGCDWFRTPHVRYVSPWKEAK